MKRTLFGLVLVGLVLALAGCPSSSPSVYVDDVPAADQFVDQVNPPPDTVVEPEGCQSDEDCPEGVCNPYTNTCVECMTHGDCPDKHECDKWVCLPLPECETDEDCPDGLMCWSEEEVCVECLEDEDCPGGECLDNHCALPCDDGCPEGMVCDELTNYCVECLGDEDCLLEEWCYLMDNECVADQCVPGAKACVGNSTAVCAENGSGWTDLQPCPANMVCLKGECTDDFICEPGLVTCQDEVTLLICNKSGTELYTEPCPEEQICKNGKCIDDKPQVCDPGESKCQGQQIIVCNEEGTGWDKMEKCPEGTVCQDGLCQPVEPTPCYETLLCMMDFKTQEPDPFFFEQCVGPEGPADMAVEIFYCVFEMCGEWVPGSDCFADALYGDMCGWLYQECTGVCVPNCAGKECGNDGCGGKCGWCDDGYTCEYGQCVPWGTYSCKEVINCMMEMPCPDPDGWPCLLECTDGNEPPELAVDLFYCVSEFCGMWNPYDDCFKFALMEGCMPLYEECMEECVPNCAGKECGSDGCGGSCGWCPDDMSCQYGKCVPGGGGECGEILECMMNEECIGPEPYVCLDMCVGPNQDPPDVLFELVECVVAMCGWWNPYDECFFFASEEMCYPLFNECLGGCVPSCAGKQCGPDGCGGLCGTCPAGMACTNAGKCEKPCEPMCWSADGTIKECGSDGCGGSCGTCPPGSSCDSAGHCIQTCIPDCAGKECGSDGCGGSCGWCDNDEECFLGECTLSLTCEELTQCIWDCPPYGEQCQNNCWLNASAAAKQQWIALVTCIEEVCGENGPDGCFQQAINGPCKQVWNACQNCTPECLGKQCGPDGCGGTCGQCPGGFVCDDYGTCLCQPQCQGKECGNDGCGGSCGSCSGSEVCNAWGYCVCLPQCEGKECGPDGCGGSCGSCPGGQSCTNYGVCTGPTEKCGDNFCQVGQGENCETCPEDCGPCEGSCCEAHDFPGCDDQKVMDCVCQMDPFCCESMWDELCVDEAWQCGGCGGCQPNCFNKECGADGCGGSCGTCPPGSTCNSGGICEQTCVPDCADKECGSDGCGGSCGLCGPGQACDDGECVIALSCAEMLDCLWSCPPNDEACNSECWQDASPDAHQQWWAINGCVAEICGEEPEEGCWQEAINGPCADLWYACQDCTPDCVGKQCGDDGCGGSCGNCPGGYVCDNFGTCLCQPDCDGKVCGNDGCGGSCGTCPEGNVCNYLGQCVCMPDCVGKECGGDGCGGSCGQCPVGYACSAAGQCVEQQNKCGNGMCQPGWGENCESCPEDCGPCQTVTCEQFFDCMMNQPCVDLPPEICMFECAEGQEPPDVGYELVYCVMDMCGAWNPDDGCLEMALAFQCGELYELCVGGCQPNCWGKQCGPDGCGGVCGYCPPGSTCNDAGQCVSADKCGNGYCQEWLGEDCQTCPEDCGPCGCGDGFCDLAIGEDCESCPEDCGPCNTGSCCEPKNSPGCNDPDVVACVCAMDSYCCQVAWDGICVDEAQSECGLNCDEPCEPQCVSEDGVVLECGADGCGGSCGQCAADQECVNGFCQAPCEPQCTIFGFPKQCGDDGCGGSCGECPEGTACDPVTFQCTGGCVPDCDGKECGNDGCGGTCGSCAAGELCQNNQCVPSASCSEMVECAMECGFAMNCSWGCMNGGDSQSQSAFQSLAMCVVQNCGLNVDIACVLQSFELQCAKQYETCMAD